MLDTRDLPPLNLQPLSPEAASAVDAKPKFPPRKPRRQALPEHLHCVEHRHELESTDSPEPECGRPMMRIGGDTSERLDIVPAEFFVHRRIYGKWACRYCRTLKQAPSIPGLIERGEAASGLVTPTHDCRFVDHLRYRRQNAIKTRGWLQTPRFTLAIWAVLARQPTQLDSRIEELLPHRWQPSSAC